MSGGKTALDTNVAIAILNNQGEIGRWLRKLEDVSLPVPVLGELRFGAVKSSRPKENLQRIEWLAAQCQILEILSPTTEVYADIRLSLSRKGRPIPENDLWIAALCIERSCRLTTFDPHFDRVEDLDVEVPDL